jgi:hypothetical protein
LDIASTSLLRASRQRKGPASLIGKPALSVACMNLFQTISGKDRLEGNARRFCDIVQNAGEFYTRTHELYALSDFERTTLRQSPAWPVTAAPKLFARNIAARTARSATAKSRPSSINTLPSQRSGANASGCCVMSASSSARLGKIALYDG